MPCHQQPPLRADGLAVHSLDAFAAGKGDRKVETLKVLTKILYPHAEFDEVKNLLRPSNRQEAMGFILPPRFDAANSPHTYRHDPSKPQIGPQPVKPEKSKPRASRPGWLSTWQT